VSGKQDGRSETVDFKASRKTLRRSSLVDESRGSRPGTVCHLLPPQLEPRIALARFGGGSGCRRRTRFSDRSGTSTPDGGNSNSGPGLRSDVGAEWAREFVLAHEPPAPLARRANSSQKLGQHEGCGAFLKAISRRGRPSARPAQSDGQQRARGGTCLGHSSIVGKRDQRIA